MQNNLIYYIKFGNQTTLDHCEVHKISVAKYTQITKC